MNINTSVSNAQAGIQGGDQSQELMSKLSQILSNSGASTDSGSEVKNEDLALKDSLSVAVQNQMGVPEEPSIEHEMEAINSLTNNLADQESFQALLGKVMAIIIQSSSEQSASRREQRVTEMTQGLENSLDAAAELRSGAQSALITSMVSAGVSLGAGLGGIGTAVKSMKSNASAQNLRTEAGKLQNPDMAGLATASAPELANAPLDVAEAGGASIDALKESLLTKALQKEQTAQKMGIATDALGRLSATSTTVGSAAANSQMSFATAAQAEQEAYARRDQSEQDIAAEWQGRMAEVRNQMLQILQEINRTNTASQSSAFQNM